MGEALFYILLAVVALLVIVAAVLTARLLKAYYRARRLEKMRSYETILYAALYKIGPERTLETLFPNPDRKVLEEVLLRMGDEGAEGWKEKVVELYELCGFADKRLRQLRSPLKSKRSDAARRLGQVNDPRAVPHLRELLWDGKEEVREAALYALGRMGTREALEAMMEALERGGRWSQEKVCEAVEEAGEESCRLLLELLKDESPMRRAFAAEVMGRVGGAAEAALLVEALGDEAVDVRARAADSLGRLLYRPSRPALLRALDDPAWEVRSQAAKAMGRLGEPEDAPRLREALRDREWWVRSNAAAALREMGEAGEGPLVEALWDEDRFARETAAQALEEGSVVERIIKGIREGKEVEEGKRILHRLAEIGCTGTISQVLSDLPDDEVKTELISLFADIQDEAIRVAITGAAGARQGKRAPTREGGGERERP